MLARTHGQTASPTTLGKEMAIFAYRLARQRQRVKDSHPYYRTKRILVWVQQQNRLSAHWWIAWTLLSTSYPDLMCSGRKLVWPTLGVYNCGDSNTSPSDNEIRVKLAIIFRHRDRVVVVAKGSRTMQFLLNGIEWPARLRCPWWRSEPPSAFLIGRSPCAGCQRTNLWKNSRSGRQL